DDERRIARAAAHRAVIDAEQHRVAAGARRRVGEHLRHELDALATDAGEEDLALHSTRLPGTVAVAIERDDLADRPARRRTVAPDRPAERHECDRRDAPRQPE